ncbi:MAG TPA: glycine cleavage T C-terminal barrel domain-containing protein, partial [Candidatus Acidoferrales bacterium]|nr:glycine cleavage T C-terminal barrel domain-containing protein [Candidatus Acidoferrales bacterium]
RELCGLDLNSLEEFAHAESTIAGISCRVIRTSTAETPGAEFLTSRENLTALWTLLLDAVTKRGGGPVGYEALNILRLEEGVAWYGVDFDENQIPHQAALEATHISYTKGCYTGQEIVERVRSRGQIQRRRVMLRFSDDAIPRVGEPLFAPSAENSVEHAAENSAEHAAENRAERATKNLPEHGAENSAEHGAEIGFVTGAARSPKFGAVIGMGYVRREQMDPGRKVKWSGGAAEVFELPAPPKKSDPCA